jgi:LPXTG-motif cell wall-anchored protein
MGKSKGYMLMAMGLTMVMLVAAALMAKPAAAHKMNAPLAQAATDTPTVVMTGTEVASPTVVMTGTEVASPTVVMTGTEVASPTAMVSATVEAATPTTMVSATVEAATPTEMVVAPTVMVADTATPTSNTGGVGVGLPTTGGSTLPTTGSSDGSGILLLGLLGVALFGIGLIMTRRVKAGAR